MRSQLVRRRVDPQAPCGALLALHSNGADANELLDLCRRAAPNFTLCAAQAPRSRNPLLSSGSGGERWAAYVGYEWYRVDPAARPEPATFGDSLWQVEQLGLELRSEGGPVHVIGLREGAGVALAAAAVSPGLFDSVVAIAGGIPDVAGWDPGTIEGRPPTLRLEGVEGDLAGRIREWLGRRKNGSE